MKARGLCVQLYEGLYDRLHAIPLDDDDEVACNAIDSQFSDKELRFLIARNRSMYAQAPPRPHHATSMHSLTPPV
eukprot:COSAG02_NODE_7591_length_2944_cov_1.834095_2_plen_75_part_00